MTRRRCAVALGYAVVMLMGHPSVAGNNGSLLDAGAKKDLELTPGPEITLAQALAGAESRNLTLSSMQQEIEKSEALYSKSLGLLLPAVQGSLSYTHLDHRNEVDLLGRVGAPTGGAAPMEPLIVQQRDSLNGGISIHQPLVDVRSWLGVKAARQGVALAKLSVESARRQLSLSVARAYLLALSSFHLIALHKRLLESAEEHLRIAQNRLSAGGGVRLDVLRARADLEDAEQSLADALLVFDTARDALGVLIGADGLPMPREVALLQNPPLDDIREKSALEDRADIAVDQKRIDLVRLERKIAWAALLPELQAVWQGSAQFTDPPDIADPDQERWSVMLSLTVPIFNWASYAEIRYRRAAHRQLVIDKENTELTAKQEIRQAKREYLTALHNVEAATRRVEVAREALLLTERAFNAGSGSSLEVTDARKNSAAAGVNLITARLKAQSALLSLLHAAGKDIATVEIF